MAFQYHVIRLWELPVETFLEGRIGTLPLAPLAKLPQANVPVVVERIKTRLKTEASSSDARILWTITYLLMGMRYDKGFTAQLGMKGVFGMKESVTYQRIVQEGRVEGKAEEARRFLLLVGATRFGRPAAHTLAAINKIGDVTRLEELGSRIMAVRSWKDLLK